MDTLLENPRAQPAVAPTRTPANPSQRILVVEDDAVIRQVNALGLVRSGFSPHQLLKTVEEVLRAAGRAGFGREICFPLLADALRQSSPYPHWGINE
jgi:hypothetical protein